MTDAIATAGRLRRWQGITLGTLFVGYMGYYVCRVNLSIATPLLLDEYQSVGLKKAHIGDVVSVGTLFYAAGKLFNGVLTEYLGGRRMFLCGMIVSILCTLLFALTPRMEESLAPLANALALPVAIMLPMMLIWSANRFVQSMGWGGLVQMVSRWFPTSRMATVMGILCMSYLLGDALARGYLSQAIRLGLDWRGLFLLAAGTLGVVTLGTMIFLKNRPSDLGLPEPPPPPGNVYGDDAGRERIPLGQLLKPLLKNYVFWLVCLMNAGLTLIRESFNTWTPTYLKETLGIDPAQAGTTSLVFPLSGAAAVLLCGWLVDKCGGRYGPVVGVSFLLLVASLVLMAVVDVNGRMGLALALVAAVAFAMMGPYSFCSGVLAVRIGGQRAGSTTAGLVDTAGYLGALGAGSGIGRIADAYGWPGVFVALAAVAGLTLVVALLYVWHGDKRS